MSREVDVPAHASRTASRGLPGLGVSVRHHLPLIAAALILALGFAGFYVSTLTLSYSSSAVVLLSPAPGNPLTAESASGSGVQLTVAMETEEQLVQTLAVRLAASETLGREVPGDGERLQVATRPNTQMLEFEFTSDTPDKAQAGAQAFAESYLDFRAEEAQATQQRRVDVLQEQLDETDASLQRAIDQAGDSDASTYASQEVQLHAGRLAQLTTALSTAQGVSTHPGSVLNPAEPPESANGLPPWLVLAAAGVGGVFLGILVALLWEWRRDLVRGDGAADLGVPVFTHIVADRRGDLADAAGGASHEAYRRLRAAVIANGPRPHVLAVAPVSGEQTMVVANLAVVLAEARLSVLLVATDPESLGVRALGLAERPGVAEVVGRGADASSLIMRSHGVSVLTPGLDSLHVRDVAATPAFHRLIQDMRQRFDYVLLEGVRTAGDEMLLVGDSVLLVLTQDQTTRGQVTATLERLEQLGVRLLGAVRVQEPRGSAGLPTPAQPADNSGEHTDLERTEFRALA